MKAKKRAATVKFQEVDQKVKDVKSELEEAWYEHDHAVQQKRNPQPYLDIIAGLDKKKAALDKDLDPAYGESAISSKKRSKRFSSGAKDIENELGKMTAERDKWVRVMENVTFKLGPFTFFKIPKIQQVSLR